MIYGTRILDLIPNHTVSARLKSLFSFPTTIRLALNETFPGIPSSQEVPSLVRESVGIVMQISAIGISHGLVNMVDLQEVVQAEPAPLLFHEPRSHSSSSAFPATQSAHAG